MHLAQYLHTEHRLLRAGDRRRNDILAFTDKFVQDLQERKIPGHGAASLHLLSLYKEAEAYSRGEALWTWLQRQDEDYVTSRVYGAAIELLAYKGEKLSELEKLYVQALNRFPGTFAEYHFSPGAMLPDRSVEIAYKGLPTLLLQGILTARVLHGDWRSSYLAFDTCMRLFPTQVPPRIFEIFIFERPLREAYTVFMLACRAGIILKAKTLSQLLNRFAIELTRSSWLVQDSKSTGIVLKLIDNMTEAVYAYTAAGGKPNDLQMSCFLDALHRLLPNSYSVTIEQAQSTLGRRNLIVSTAMKIVSAFSSVTSESRVNAFNRLLLMSGKANLPQVMEKIQNDMIATEITMNDGTYRAIVLASGHLEDQRAVEKSWGDLVKHSQDIGMQLSGLDWNALAKATALAANPKYALGQLNELHRGSLGEASDALQQVQERTLGTADDSSPLVKLLDQSALEDVLQRVTAKFETIFDMVVKQEAKDLRDIPIHMMMDDHLNALPGSKDDHHQIYEELTRWPSEQHPAGELFKDKTRAQARTGYFFDELRFENWQTINYLLAIAEQHSVEREEAIERAIEAGAPIKSINSSVIDRAFGKPPCMICPFLPFANSTPHLSDIGHTKVALFCH